MESNLPHSLNSDLILHLTRYTTQVLIHYELYLHKEIEYLEIFGINEMNRQKYLYSYFVNNLTYTYACLIALAHLTLLISILVSARDSSLPMESLYPILKKWKIKTILHRSAQLFHAYFPNRMKKINITIFFLIIDF